MVRISTHDDPIDKGTFILRRTMHGPSKPVFTKPKKKLGHFCARSKRGRALGLKEGLIGLFQVGL